MSMMPSVTRVSRGSGTRITEYAMRAPFGCRMSPWKRSMGLGTIASGCFAGAGWQPASASKASERQSHRPCARPSLGLLVLVNEAAGLESQLGARLGRIVIFVSQEVGAFHEDEASGFDLAPNHGLVD